MRLAVVAARYNEPIVAGLLEGATAAWARCGGAQADLRLERVPGAFELPLAARQFALVGAIDAVVALGCVIRGDTAHFEYVAGECAHGLARVMLDTGVPVSFGVLTVDTLAQARERAAPNASNKGSEAVETAVAMVGLLRRIK
ncbi:MAG: 6,7-dimethyl-8-ribityllumazine synthase [Steroidobacterales bacterium]